MFKSCLDIYHLIEVAKDYIAEKKSGNKNDFRNHYDSMILDI